MPDPIKILWAEVDIDVKDNTSTYYPQIHLSLCVGRRKLQKIIQIFAQSAIAELERRINEVEALQK